MGSARPGDCPADRDTPVAQLAEVPDQPGDCPADRDTPVAQLAEVPDQLAG